MRNWTPKKFATRPQVGVAVATYLNGDDWVRREAALACLLNSFRAQTYQHWQVRVVHDGPLSEDDHPRPPLPLTDLRIRFDATAERKQMFGHPHRQAAVAALIAGGAEWVGLTNDDNYYVPVYFEWMVAAALEKKADLVYCDAVHSHKLWKPLPGDLRRGHIDVGGFLVHARVAAQVEFDQFTFAGDWDYISRLRAKARGVVKVPATLFVHN